MYTWLTNLVIVHFITQVHVITSALSLYIKKEYNSFSKRAKTALFFFFLPFRCLHCPRMITVCPLPRRRYVCREYERSFVISYFFFHILCVLVCSLCTNPQTYRLRLFLGVLLVSYFVGSLNPVNYRGLHQGQY